MTEAIRLHVRYDTKNEDGLTRRERNENFGYPSPALKIPLGGMHIWNWYHELSQSVRRVYDGVCTPIPPTEFVAWTVATKNIVYPVEYAILREMDSAFCEETNKELDAFRAREEQRRQNNFGK